MKMIHKGTILGLALSSLLMNGCGDFLEKEHERATNPCYDQPNHECPEAVAPVGIPAAYTAEAGEPLDITLFATAPGEQESLTYALTINPTHGTMSGTNNTWVYTADATYIGADYFAFVASNGYTTSVPTGVDITVVPAGTTAGNTPPVCSSQTVGCNPGETTTITLSAFDADEGEELSYTVSKFPSHGDLVGAGNTWKYSPDNGFVGADSFSFYASDHESNSNTAVITLQVGGSVPGNNPPVATSMTVGVFPGVATEITLTGQDVDGDQLTYRITKQPTKGTLIGSNDSWEYNATGTSGEKDSFEFVVSDGQENSAPAKVSITIN